MLCCVVLCVSTGRRALPPDAAGVGGADRAAQDHSVRPTILPSLCGGTVMVGAGDRARACSVVL